MHVIFGGAFNGKRAYVEKMLHVGTKTSVDWIDAAAETHVLSPNTEVIVVFGVEHIAEPDLSILLLQNGTMG